MRIILRDAQTGEILVTGVTQGGTGNTKLLMHEDSRAILPVRAITRARTASVTSPTVAVPIPSTVHRRHFRPNFRLDPSKC